MRMLLLLLLLLTVGMRCSNEVKARPTMELSCSNVGSSLYRCENSEVVCYSYYSTGLQCKWKGDTK
jgi:hypothetical protein